MAAAASLRGRQGRSSLGSHAMRQMGQMGAWFWASLKSKLWRMQALQTAWCTYGMAATCSTGPGLARGTYVSHQ